MAAELIVLIFNDRLLAGFGQHKLNLMLHDENMVKDNYADHTLLPLRYSTESNKYIILLPTSCAIMVHQSYLKQMVALHNFSYYLSLSS